MNKSISIPILNDEYKVIVCWGTDQFMRSIFRRWGYTDIPTNILEGRRGSCYIDTHCHPVITLPKKPKTPQEIGTLAHEATHAVFNIFEKLGSEYETNHETFTHSVGAVVRKVLEYQ